MIETATQGVIATIPLGNAIPSGVTITPDGQHVFVGTQAFDSAHHRRQHAHVLNANFVGGQALRVTSTPSMIVPVRSALSIANDADLTPLGFGGYITFRGGVLQATHDIFTSRHVSLLSQGGTIDTQQFAVEIAGATVNAGILAKRGAGTLTLSGNSAHQITHVIQGTLAVLGKHTGSVRVGRAATLAGTGTVASVDASLGHDQPGRQRAGRVACGRRPDGTVAYPGRGDQWCEAGSRSTTGSSRPAASRSTAPTWRSCLAGPCPRARSSPSSRTRTARSPAFLKGRSS